MSAKGVKHSGQGTAAGQTPATAIEGDVDGPPGRAGEPAVADLAHSAARPLSETLEVLVSPLQDIVDADRRQVLVIAHAALFGEQPGQGRTPRQPADAGS